ncbi:MAG: hypothetical protein ACJ786_17260 [Catenulispora sp.]
MAELVAVLIGSLRVEEPAVAAAAPTPCAHCGLASWCDRGRGAARAGLKHS